MKQKQKNQEAQSHDRHISMADERVLEGVQVNQLFVAPNGNLYKCSFNIFFKASIHVDGIELTELWGDAYEANLTNTDSLLFPADFNCPFSVKDHEENRDRFIEKGGGFRLDLKYAL